MYGNEKKVRQIEKRMMERYVDASAEYFGTADWLCILCSDPIFHFSAYYIFITYDSISTWYNIDDSKAAE